MYDTGSKAICAAAPAIRTSCCRCWRARQPCRRREDERMSQGVGIGAAPRRKEDLRFLTGRGNYVADIKRPGMVAGVFVRSPHAHARIRSIDPAAALAMPAVLAVFSGEDLKAAGVGGLPCGWGV